MIGQKTILCTAIAALTTLTFAATTAPPPGPTAVAAARFLEQAAFGPTASSVAEVQALGFSAWIDAQMALPSSQWSVIPDPSVNTAGNTSLRPAQDAFFTNAVNGKDQLRQRVAFALAQIWVISGVKLAPEAIVPYLRLLQKDAFTTYDQLMYDVTLSPAMGHYLDMVNNNKPTPGHGANENYAREVLQLFTIGLVELDSSGRPILKNGVPIPSYTQDNIEGFARTFTGWTYAPKPGANSRFGNPSNWTAPMVAFQANHDTGAKALLNGYTLPAGQTADTDLKDALHNIFTNSNVGPFICRELIQRLVTSNPSPAYVNRIVTVFNNSAQRGDLKNVIKAILLDTEARKGDDGSENIATKLREPVLNIAAMLRGLGATVVSPNSMTTYASRLGQTIYYPPTVFDYFLPGYNINITSTQTYNAPEFQLLGEATAMGAADFANTVAYQAPTGVTVNLTPYINPLGAKPAATDITKMVESLDVALMGGRMGTIMRDTIVTAASKQTTPKAMVQTAVYLICSSWNYQIER